VKVKTYDELKKLVRSSASSLQSLSAAIQRDEKIISFGIAKNLPHAQ
jgi:hypothetical protein